ncbi:MAG TPA: EAL domain-containing protein [Caulobacteraceae bacterium]|nr:EAL domain-containing protein [Caulobacteraceae bacterium]
MRKITVALLSAAYLCLALTGALLLWRSGGGWGAGVAGLMGGLGLAFALHNLIERNIERARLDGEVGAVREAHLILVEQLEAIQTQLRSLSEVMHDDAERRSEELTGEMRMLEDLVQRLSESLDERLANVQAAPGPASHKSQQSAALLDTVRQALAENRVDLYLQPVVSLPQRRTVFYESFSRLRDETGRIMMPAEYLTVAEPEGLVSAIDNLLLFRCAQIVRRLARQDRKVGIFCNIALGSLSDETFFPQFLDFLSSNKDMAGSLIFELGQSAFKQRGATEARNMAKLADLGFRFSLDKVTDLDFDFQDLSRADVKFVKVAADLLLQQLDEVDGRLTLKSLRDIQASDFAAMTRRFGVELIAEKIETERQVVDVLDLDLAYGQGHLFGEPRAIREQVLAEAEPPADFIRSPLRRRAAGW